MIATASVATSFQNTVLSGQLLLAVPVVGAIPKMVEGHLLSDVIAINASVDIVMGEVDR